jgi:hypothetical protein
MTWQGRLFVCCYGLVGVPLAMLVIADVGKFIAILMRRLTKGVKKLYHNRSMWPPFARNRKNSSKTFTENGLVRIPILKKKFNIIFLIKPSHYRLFTLFIYCWAR